MTNSVELNNLDLGKINLERLVSADRDAVPVNGRQVAIDVTVILGREVKHLTSVGTEPLANPDLANAFLVINTHALDNVATGQRFLTEGTNNKVGPITILGIDRDTHIVSNLHGLLTSWADEELANVDILLNVILVTTIENRNILAQLAGGVLDKLLRESHLVKILAVGLAKNNVKTAAVEGSLHSFDGVSYIKLSNLMGPHESTRVERVADEDALLVTHYVFFLLTCFCNGENF